MMLYAIPYTIKERPAFLNGAGLSFQFDFYAFCCFSRAQSI